MGRRSSPVSVNAPRKRHCLTLSARFDLYVLDCQGGSWPGLFAPQVLIYGNLAQVLQVVSPCEKPAEYGEIGREAYPFSQVSRAAAKHTTVVLTLSKKVLANWPAWMSSGAGF